MFKLLLGTMPATADDKEVIIINGMSNIVMEMLLNGASDVEVCNQLGLEAEELVRLKYITGYAKLYENNEYSRAKISEKQAAVAAEYRKENGQ